MENNILDIFITKLLSFPNEHIGWLIVFSWFILYLLYVNVYKRDNDQRDSERTSMIQSIKDLHDIFKLHNEQEQLTVKEMYRDIKELIKTTAESKSKIEIFGEIADRMCKSGQHK